MGSGNFLSLRPPKIHKDVTSHSDPIRSYMRITTEQITACVGGQLSTSLPMVSISVWDTDHACVSSCCVLHPSTCASKLQKELCHIHRTSNTELSHLNSFREENDCPQRSSVCRDRTVPKIIPTEIPAIKQNAWLKTSMFSLLYSFLEQHWVDVCFYFRSIHWWNFPKIRLWSILEVSLSLDGMTLTAFKWAFPSA